MSMPSTSFNEAIFSYNDITSKVTATKNECWYRDPLFLPTLTANGSQHSAAVVLLRAVPTLLYLKSER